VNLLFVLINNIYDVSTKGWHCILLKLEPCKQLAVAESASMQMLSHEDVLRVVVPLISRRSRRHRRPLKVRGSPPVDDLLHEQRRTSVGTRT